MVDAARSPSRRVLPLLLVAYAASYVCRANVEPALNVLAVQRGYDNEQVGAVLGAALGAYAVGKVVLGPLADLSGGKRALVFALGASVIVSFAIALVGPHASLATIGVFVIANRFFQAGGWSGLVEVVGRTFPRAKRGTIMGLLSTSFDIGNIVALVLSAALVDAGFGWRALFVVNPALVAVVAIVVAVFLPSPPQTRVEEASQNDGPNEPPRLRAIASFLVRRPTFWLAALLSFLLTFVRAGFMTWTPRFLYEVSVAAGEKSALSSSIARSAFFGAAGMTGSLITGRLADRGGPGRRAPVMTASLVLLVVSIVLLGHAGVTRPALATAGVAACGLFLLGPYSLLAGAVALDIASDRRAAGTAAGIVDAVGYVGASLAAVVLGSVSKRLGWSAAFDVLALVALLALASSAAWSLRTRTGSRPE